MSSDRDFGNWFLIILAIVVIACLSSESDSDDPFKQQIKVMKNHGYVIGQNTEVNAHREFVARVRKDAVYYLLTDKEVTVSYLLDGEMLDQERLLFNNHLNMNGYDQLVVTADQPTRVALLLGYFKK